MNRIALAAVASLTAVASRLPDRQAVRHGDHFWFAWAVFVPHSGIWTAEGIVNPDGEE